MGQNIFLLVEIVALVFAIQFFFKTAIGRRVGDFLPTPFWIYFFPIILSTVGFFPPEAPLYDLVGLHVLPAALILMLIGTPVSALISLGPKATIAMVIGTVTMVVATFISFFIFTRWMPVESFKGVAALLATWTGGSANMIAVKEIVGLTDHNFAPLVIVDTILSYSWMALLILGAAYQKKYDAGLGVIEGGDKNQNLDTGRVSETKSKKIFGFVLVLFFSFSIAEIMIWIGRYLASMSNLLNAKGWAILLSSTFTIFLATTQLKNLEKLGASKIGGFLLYLVLATIGAKTTLKAALDAPLFLGFGIVVLALHGVLALWLGRVFKIPLFLLSTSSQANVGGPISAPLVAEIYQPGTAQFGVIMGVIGNVVGTYVGLFGAWVCHFMEKVK